MQQVCEVRPAAGVVRYHTEAKQYRGIGRLAYFFGMVGASVFSAVCNIAAESQPAVALLAWLALNGLAFVLVVNRLRNIGMSGWWSLLILIPLANIYIGIKCLVCPEGYEDTKTLDTAGKTIAAVAIGVVVLAVVGVLLALSGW